jgi:tRNA G10  N-methylase Trm11
MKQLEWYGLYRDSWQGEIVEQAFAHPAKFSRGLIRAIYDHLIEQGYLKPGDKVIDPFGGVALGGLDAMRHGLHWTGVELEEKFVALAEQNIALWERRYRPHFPAWGTAAITQGDSRRLVELVGAADGALCSPPYANGAQHTGGDDTRPEFIRGGELRYVDYGRTPGQLGSMREGDFDGALTSPPYADAVNGSGEGPDARHDPIYHNGDNAYKQSSQTEYGRTPGNLGNMAGDGYEAVVTSPPFEQVTNNVARVGRAVEYTGHRIESYGDHPANIGNDTGQTFWTAARQILEQTHQVLKPGAVAAFVCGDFVRNRQRVYFGRQWLALCEAVGFEPLEWITAWKTETHGTQLDIFGNGHARKVDRVSFFRRLANEKTPEAAILSEDVIIVRKPLD